MDIVEINLCRKILKENPWNFPGKNPRNCKFGLPKKKPSRFWYLVGWAKKTGIHPWLSVQYRQLGKMDYLIRLVVVIQVNTAALLLILFQLYTIFLFSIFYLWQYNVKCIFRNITSQKNTNLLLHQEDHQYYNTALNDAKHSRPSQQ